MKKIAAILGLALLLTSPAHAVKVYSYPVTSADEVSSGPVKLLSIHAQNRTLAPAFLQVFRSRKSQITLGTNSPDICIMLPVSKDVPVVFSEGWYNGNFTGLTVAATTARQNNTTAVTEVQIEYQ